MAIKQVGIKNSQGTYEYTDIGVNSSNVDMTSGNNLQTDFNALQTQVGNKANATDLAALQTVVAGKQDIIQLTTMPTAAASNVNKIYQYVGATTTTDPIYKNGYFYRCTEDTTTGTTTYSWEVVSGGGVESISEADYRTLESQSDPAVPKGVYDPDRYFFIENMDVNGWVATEKKVATQGSTMSLTYNHSSIHTTSLIRIVAEAHGTKNMPATGDNEVAPIQARINYQDEGSAQIIFDKQPDDTDFWLLIRNEDGVDDIIDGSPTGTGNPLDWTWDPAGTHNSIYRGKYLGNSYTAAQKAAIQAGTFDDMYIGDYWTIGGVNYRIAAFDYWYKCGDTECAMHHVVLVPDSNFTAAKMNETNVATGGYVGSDMYTGNNSNTGLSAAKAVINAAFGSANILNHRENLTNAVSTEGMASAGAWYDSTVDLMNEKMVYGCSVFEPAVHKGSIPTKYTIDKSQLPLFRFRPGLICNRVNWWLRDVVSSSSFASVHGNGNANYHGASASNGVRPAFGLC